MRASQLAFLIFSVSGLSCTQAVAAAPILAPHRAVYDLSLERASERSGINGISGRMVYEFKGSACEGYTTRFRFVTQIETEEISRLTDQQTTTRESGDGKSMRFETKSFVDETLDNEVRGNATTDPDGTKVVLEKPEARTVALPPTHFPSEHTKELITKAKNGERFYQTSLFDGTDEADEIMETTVIVGEAEPVADEDPEAPALKPIRADTFWPVTIAYFDGAEKSGEETPDYNVSFKLHKSGVTRDLVMDYGEFAIRGRLVDLAMFKPEAGCEAR